MEASMKDNGNKIRLMGKGLFIIQMEMFIKANGHKIKPMDMESILILMEPSIQANGKMTNNMAKVFNSGWMVKNTKDNIRMEPKQAKECLNF